MLWGLALSSSLCIVVYVYSIRSWISEYRRDLNNGGPVECAKRRQFRNDSFKKWRVEGFVSALPIALNVEIALFLVGLVVKIWDKHTLPAKAILSVSVILYVLNIIFLIIPAFCDSCPYRSTGPILIAHLMRRLYKASVNALARLFKRERPPLPRHGVDKSRIIEEAKMMEEKDVKLKWGVIQWLLENSVKASTVHISLLSFRTLPYLPGRAAKLCNTLVPRVLYKHTQCDVVPKHNEIVDPEDGRQLALAFDYSRGLLHLLKCLGMDIKKGKTIKMSSAQWNALFSDAHARDSLLNEEQIEAWKDWKVNVYDRKVYQHLNQMPALYISNLCAAALFRRINPAASKPQLLPPSSTAVRRPALPTFTAPSKLEPLSEVLVVVEWYSRALPLWNGQQRAQSMPVLSVLLDSTLHILATFDDNAATVTVDTRRTSTHALRSLLATMDGCDPTFVLATLASCMRLSRSIQTVSADIRMRICEGSLERKKGVTTKSYTFTEALNMVRQAVEDDIRDCNDESAKDTVLRSYFLFAFRAAALNPGQIAAVATTASTAILADPIFVQDGARESLVRAVVESIEQCRDSRPEVDAVQLAALVTAVAALHPTLGAGPTTAIERLRNSITADNYAQSNGLWLLQFFIGLDRQNLKSSAPRDVRDIATVQELLSADLRSSDVTVTSRFGDVAIHFAMYLKEGLISHGVVQHEIFRTLVDTINRSMEGSNILSAQVLLGSLVERNVLGLSSWDEPGREIPRLLPRTKVLAAQSSEQWISQATTIASSKDAVPLLTTLGLAIRERLGLQSK